MAVSLNTASFSLVLSLETEAWSPASLAFRRFADSCRTRAPAGLWDRLRLTLKTGVAGEAICPDTFSLEEDLAAIVKQKEFFTKLRMRRVKKCQFGYCIKSCQIVILLLSAPRFDKILCSTQFLKWHFLTRLIFKKSEILSGGTGRFFSARLGLGLRRMGPFGLGLLAQKSWPDRAQVGPVRALQNSNLLVPFLKKQVNK